MQTRDELLKLARYWESMVSQATAAIRRNDERSYVAVHRERWLDHCMKQRDIFLDQLNEMAEA